MRTVRALLALMGTLGTLGTLVACGASIPAPIAREERGGRPGEIVVVEFVDFECPFCRRLDESFAAVVSRHAGHVHVARKQVPLATMHPHALDAAHASVCADEMGKGDPMAGALFRAPTSSLTRDGIAELGATLGIEANALRACMDDPRTKARVDEDSALFDAIGGEGVPLLFIGDTRIAGAEDETMLDAAVTRALAASR